MLWKGARSALLLECWKRRQRAPGSGSPVRLNNKSAAAPTLDLLLRWIYDYFIDSVFTLIYSELLSLRHQSPGQKQKLPTQQHGSFTVTSLSVWFCFNYFLTVEQKGTSELYHRKQHTERLSFKCFHSRFKWFWRMAPLQKLMETLLKLILLDKFKDADSFFL